MPIIASWLDLEESIVLLDYQGRWSWDEATAVNAQAAAMIASKPYRCDVIGNMRPGTMESVSPAISNARKILAGFPDNIGLIVVVSNPLISMLASVFKGLDTHLSKNLRTVTTVEQARSLIANDRIGTL